MIRLFKHYVPHAVLLLGMVDFALLLLAGELGWVVRANQIGMAAGHFTERWVQLVSFALLIVFAPLVWRAVVAHAPLLEPFTARLNVSRYVIATLLTLGGLFIAHAVLPDGRRRLLDTLPGVAATLLLWLASGVAFGAWLAGFADYVSTYAGLAGAMTALIFLDLISICFVFGGELNAAILRRRARKLASA